MSEHAVLPSLPIQEMPSLEMRLAQVDSFHDLSDSTKYKIKMAIQQSAVDCERYLELAKVTVRIKDIQRATAAHFNIAIIDMLSHRRTLDVILPRHIAMYLAKTLTFRSLTEIGRLFDRRDHTTILHATRKITKLIKTDEALAANIAALKEKLMP